MPTFRVNLHLGGKDPLMQTDDISDGAVTLEKTNIPDASTTQRGFMSAEDKKKIEDLEAASVVIESLDVTKTYTPTHIGTKLYLCTNSAGAIEGGVVGMNSSIGNLVHPSEVSAGKTVGCHLGDILVVTKRGDSYIGKLLTDDEAYLPNGSLSVHGLINSEEKKHLVDGYPTITFTSNMNEALETGVYPWCTTGRPSGATGAFTCFTQKSTSADGAEYYSIKQIAIGRSGADEGKVYIRYIFYKSENDRPDTGWIELNHSYTTNYQQLSNKPSINNVELNGSMSLSDLDVYSKKEVGDLVNNEAVRAEGVEGEHAKLINASIKSAQVRFSLSETGLYATIHGTRNDGTEEDLGIDTKVPTATLSANGLMSSDDKSKLDGIEKGAEKNTVDKDDVTIINEIESTLIVNEPYAGPGVVVSDTGTDAIVLGWLTDDGFASSYVKVGGVQKSAPDFHPVYLDGVGYVIYLTFSNPSYPHTVTCWNGNELEIVQEYHGTRYYVVVSDIPTQTGVKQITIDHGHSGSDTITVEGYIKTTIERTYPYREVIEAPIKNMVEDTYTKLMGLADLIGGVTGYTITYDGTTHTWQAVPKN